MTDTSMGPTPEARGRRRACPLAAGLRGAAARRALRDQPRPVFPLGSPSVPLSRFGMSFGWGAAPWSARRKGTPPRTPGQRYRGGAGGPHRPLNVTVALPPPIAGTLPHCSGRVNPAPRRSGRVPRRYALCM